MITRFLTVVGLGALLAAPASALSLPDWLDFSGHAEETAGPPRPIVSEIVEGHGEDVRWIPGVVESRTQVTMAFQTLGRMVRRDVELGDRVEKDEVLAELAGEDMAASTRAARAALDAAEVQRDTARTTLERTQALADRNVASSAQLEEAQRAAAAADAAAEQARSELVQAEDAEGFARMVAPFAGVVSAVYEAPGAVVSAGAPILQLSADDRREAVIDLPDSALTGLPSDAAFTVWQRTAPTVEIAAVLDRIDPIADPATRTRRLYLTLPADAPFRLGALIRARPGTEGAPVLSLPATAVIDRDGSPHVWRVTRQDDQASVNAVAIEHTPEFQGRVLIQSGVEPGDEIVIRGIHSLEEGQAVGRRIDP
ncbi:efflux RND transporter periplasmic adaptor subunit [Paracoccus caeni]|uniref:Efflux RND transporter periplasmic adaptor subunit n=1 Tax=Paracoccus caeni TaxID=657651 RepID=A0A934VYR0_9RHOB|nr:efflux RND transporter periplasmic adaptor subunit [Paracoccus caeni]MBK4215025.1 efflux RND transporter periplasmic adaptor subunit [Paracoccus caeni]